LVIAMIFGPRTKGEHTDRMPKMSMSTEDRDPVRLGICAMAKKAKSKPMETILNLLTKFGDVEVVHFPEDVILEAPVEEWPHPVDCLISFYSDGFPLDKAVQYAELRRPCLVNDLRSQRVLLDRREVYALLKENGIPHPTAVVVDRDPVTKELRGDAAARFEEGDDFIQVGEQKIPKPFVEKPVDAEDHNICIYYPSSAGGGVKSLFRKVQNRSSSFNPTDQQVRKDGIYMYEPFMKTQGTDIKVYTVTPEYAHAEARKSPVIDGVVNRNEEGKEMRFPVVLTPYEKEIARRVCTAFQQTVCGFDLLRTASGSYVIDVNGWSFVKGLPKYYEDAAALLRAHVLHLTGRSTCVRRVDSLLELHKVEHTAEASASDETEERSSRSDRWEHEELLAVLAVMRHGDRTPKNKMKLATSRPEFLELHRRWASGPRKEAKLKAPKQLQAMLDLTYSMIGSDDNGAGDGAIDGPARANSAEINSFAPGPKTLPDPGVVQGGEAGGTCEPPDDRTVEACKLIRTVLAEGHFDGIYRKVQVKPVAWTTTESGEERASEVVVVLKYGGILTEVGRKQAEELGHVFRGEMYPGESDTEGTAATGLLRLHATQRHDFKVYSSDEGRVQMSAAAFARGLLDLEGGALTPICVALVETDSLMLDDLPSAAKPLIEEARQVLFSKITKGLEEGDLSPVTPTRPKEHGLAQSHGGGASSTGLEALSGVVDSMDCGAESVTDVPAMLDYFKQLQESIAVLCKELEVIDPATCNGMTKPLLVQRRWLKLREELWDKKRNTWNVSKITEIRDAVRFDLIHHPRIASSLLPVWEVVKSINDVIVPHEYGHDVRSRVRIGSVVCGKLLRKLLVDLSNSMTQQQPEELPTWKLTTAVDFLKRMVGFKKPEMTVPAPLPENSEVKAEEGEEDEEGDVQEAEFAGLDTRLAGPMKSPHRRVRTRLYFTSESHIQTLMNVLRYCHLAPRGAGDQQDSGAAGADGGDRLVCPEMERRLNDSPIFDYLTQIVFRLYEDKCKPPASPERFRVEVLFSPGAAGDPTPTQSRPPPLDKLVPLHAPDKPLTYSKLKELLSPFQPSASSGISATKSLAPGAPADPMTPHSRRTLPVAASDQ